MATKTETKGKTATEAPQQAPPSQPPALVIQLRIPHPKSAQDVFGISQSDWIVLTDVIFPNATSAAAILLALRYCQARKLDVMKKVVNIVPMYSKALKKMVDTIWPGIAEVRITATRTGEYAGRDEEKFGGDIEKRFNRRSEDGSSAPGVITVPEWCQLTVYKMVQGTRCAFVGPKVFWEEAYATAGRDTDAPNEMWTDRKRGQVGKCAEAAALRAAFPEETGGMLTAEEMHGRTIDGDLNPETMVVQGETMTPPRPKQSDFTQKDKAKTEGVRIIAGGHDVTEKMPLTKAELEKQAAEKDQTGEVVETAAVASTAEPVHNEGAGEATGEFEIPAFLRRGTPQPEAENMAPAPTAAFIRALAALEEAENALPNMPDLNEVKKAGRANIEAEQGITDDERDELRARFTTIVLTEQKRRGKK